MSRRAHPAQQAPPPHFPDSDLAAFVKSLKEMTHEELYEFFAQQQRSLEEDPEYVVRLLTRKNAAAERMPNDAPAAAECGGQRSL